MVDEVSENFQRCLNLLRHRRDIMIRYFPEPKQPYLDDASSLIDRLNDLVRSKAISAEKKLLLIDLSSAATGIWEAWNHSTKTNEPMFSELSSSEKQIDLVRILKHNMHVLESAFIVGGVNRVRLFTREETENVATSAMADFANNQEIVYEIRAANKPTEIRQFLSETRLFVFSGITSNLVLAVPSVSGNRIFISEQAFISTNAKQTVVHELAHNWAVWKQELDKLLISNRKPLLSAKTERLSEGDFIESRIYSKNICFGSPFCLNILPENNPVTIIKTGPLSEM